MAWKRNKQCCLLFACSVLSWVLVVVAGLLTAQAVGIHHHTTWNCNSDAACCLLAGGWVERWSPGC
jgi:hypothetical protein